MYFFLVFNKGYAQTFHTNKFFYLYFFIFCVNDTINYQHFHHAQQPTRSPLLANNNNNSTLISLLIICISFFMKKMQDLGVYIQR